MKQNLGKPKENQRKTLDSLLNNFLIKNFGGPGVFGGPGGSKAEKWPKPEREQGPKGSGPLRTPKTPKGPESVPIY